MNYSDLINEYEFAKAVGLSVWGVRAWRRRGYGPPHAKLGKKIFYDRHAVAAFVAAQFAGN